MKRKLVTSVLVIALLLASVITFYLLLPKRYLTGKRLTAATVFWNDKEAFVFLNVMTVGRAENALQQRIASSRYGWLVALRGMDFNDQQMLAYHLLSSSSIDRPELPQGVAVFGTWKLVKGKLQLTTFANAYRADPGFRWDGSKFEIVQPQARSATASSQNVAALSEDDASTEENEPDYGLLDKEQRKVFKDAGWHWKLLNGYEGAERDAILPIVLNNKAKFNLVIRSTNWQNNSEANFDFLSSGAKQLELSGGTLASAISLWHQDGWREVPKADYERRQRADRRAQVPSTLWIWLGLILLFLVWKVFAWGKLIFAVTTVKGRVLKNMATSYSFPSAVTAQFPLLDTAALERYTEDFENMGFTRLLDTSPTSDVANHPAGFYRVLVHPSHHCFGEISQIFPRGKSPMALKCSINSSLQDGWSVSFSDRKPLPGGALIRRPKAIQVSMPDSRPAELLQSLITLREQVCFDLGVSPLKNDTLEAYVAKTQQTLADMRAAVKQKNFFAGIPQFYYRKLALVKTKPEYVWLGEYPKAAEQRKRFGFAPAT